MSAPDSVVYEAGLVSGSDPGVAATSVQGTLKVSDSDGLETISMITIGDQEIAVVDGNLAAVVGTTLATDYGTLVITGYTSPEVSGQSGGLFDFVYSLNEAVNNLTQDGATDAHYVESIAVAVSDGEESANANINVKIVDDHPTVVVTASPAIATVEEDSIGQAQGVDLLNINALVEIGADSDSANVVYSIEVAEDGVDSGLRTINGDPVLLYSTGEGTMEGRTASGIQVFTMALNAETGNLNVTLLESLYHPTDEAVLHLGAGMLKATVSVMDADGDTSSDSVDLSVAIGFGDSVPVLLSATGISIDNEVPTSISGQVVVQAPDEPIAFSLAASLDYAPDYLNYTLAEDGTLVATDGSGDVVFTMEIDSSGEYTFTLLKSSPEVVALSPAFNSSNVIAAGSPTESAPVTLFDADGNAVTDVVFSGTGNLNPSNDGLGIDNGLITGAKGQSSADILSMQFADLVNDASLHIGNISTSDFLLWKVFLNGQEVDGGVIKGSYMNDGTEVPIENNEAAEYWIDLSQNGLDAGLMFDTLQITAGFGDAYKFIGFTVEKPSAIDDSDLQFAVTATDADGDESETIMLNVRVDGSGEAKEFAIDGEPVTLLVDTIDDIAGDTMLSGGDGVDVFAWHLSEPGAQDVLTDFGTTGLLEGGDALDLSELLTDADKTDLTSYLSFEDSGDGGTLVKISVAGEFTGNAEADSAVSHQTIELQGVSLSELGDPSGQAALISDLIQSGKLIIE